MVTRCRHCGRPGGHFWKVTFMGAPQGGVPVHVECVQAFFEELQNEWPYSAKARGASVGD
jgi:hypothetical protein